MKSFETYCVIDNKGTLRPFSVLFLFFFLGTIYTSCQDASNASTDEHPDFIKSALKIVDTAQPGHIDQNLALIDSMFYALPKPGLGDIFIRDSIRYAKFSYQKHDYVKALAYLDTLMELVKDHTGNEKYADRYVMLLYTKAGVYMNLKHYNESFYYIEQAEKAAHLLITDPCNLANYKDKIGYLFFVQEKYQESAIAFKEQYKVMQHGCNMDYYVMQRCANNIALSYLRYDALDSAAKYQQEALSIIQQDEITKPLNARARNAYSKAVIYGDQAEILVRKGQLENAETLYRKSIEGTLPTDTAYAQSTETRLAALYLQENKNAIAWEILNQLKSSLDIFQNERQLLQWYKLVVKYYMNTNNATAALAHQLRFESVRDSIAARNKTFINTDIGKEFENFELKYSNELLAKENKLKTLYIIIAITVFIMTVAIALLAWRNLKRTKYLHRKVQQKNEDLQTALASLEQSHKENNRIIRIVAHDLKNPISAVNTLVYSLLKKNHPEELKETLTLIKTACTSSMSLIKEVLNENKSDAGLKKELVEMKGLLEYCVNLLQPKADEKEQELRLDADEVLISLNRQKIWRVVSNIVNNAIKFSPSQSVIDIKLQRKEASVLLSVHDTGIGIPQEMQDKIFMAPAEISRPGTSGEESYGLGLSIAQTIVTEHKGKLWFDSISGKGSVFYVELPYFN
ncbi:MAG: HAMP domain-containing sensor histidine kinase [Chitinophagaceae bacterium]